MSEGSAGGGAGVGLRSRHNNLRPVRRKEKLRKVPQTTAAKPRLSTPEAGQQAGGEDPHTAVVE